MPLALALADDPEAVDEREPIGLDGAPGMLAGDGLEEPSFWGWEKGELQTFGEPVLQPGLLALVSLRLLLAHVAEETVRTDAAGIDFQEVHGVLLAAPAARIPEAPHSCNETEGQPFNGRSPGL